LIISFCVIAVKDAQSQSKLHTLAGVQFTL